MVRFLGAQKVDRRLVGRAKERYSNSLARIDESPDAACILTVETNCFGFGVKKLHKSMQDILRKLDYDGLLKDAKSLTRDDQRGLAFLSTHADEFANSFPLALTGYDAAFSPREFQVAIARKLGVPIGLLRPYVGSTIRSSGNSHKTNVDPYGNGVASATGVLGDHTRRLHDRIVSEVVRLLNEAGIRAKGGHTGSCKGIFAKCVDARLLNEDGQRLLQGIIPDMLLDGRSCGLGPFMGMRNRLVGVQTLVEHKTLAAVLTKLEARVEQVRRWYSQQAQVLDARYPGSTFSKELLSYGLNGALCVLVSGPFANLSDDFGLVVDLIAQEKATAWIEKRKVNPNAALAQFRRGLVHRLGLFITRGWSQLIIDRWRDAATNRPSQPVSAGVGLNAGVGFSSNPRRGGYCGMHVPGA